MKKKKGSLYLELVCLNNYDNIIKDHQLLWFVSIFLIQKVIIFFDLIVTTPSP